MNIPFEFCAVNTSRHESTKVPSCVRARTHIRSQSQFTASPHISQERSLPSAHQILSGTLPGQTHAINVYNLQLLQELPRVYQLLRPQLDRTPADTSRGNAGTRDMRYTSDRHRCETRFGVRTPIHPPAAAALEALLEYSRIAFFQPVCVDLPYAFNPFQPCALCLCDPLSWADSSVIVFPQSDLVSKELRRLRHRPVACCSSTDLSDCRLGLTLPTPYEVTDYDTCTSMERGRIQTVQPLVQRPASRSNHSRFTFELSRARLGERAFIYI